MPRIDANLDLSDRHPKGQVLDEACPKKRNRGRVLSHIGRGSEMQNRGRVPSHIGRGE